MFSSGLVALLLLLGFSGQIESLSSDSISVIGAFVLTGVACLWLWAFFPDIRNTRTQTIFILLVSILPRLALIDFPVSDDVNRYLWEGNLVLHSENPYTAPADAVMWNGYHDAFWDGMNHKDRLTAYPPLSLLVFGSLSALGYHPLMFKLAFVLADIGVIALLIQLLKGRGLPIRNVLLYALNPVSLFAFAGEAHFDSLFLFALVASFLAWEKKYYNWFWLLLGISIQLKFISIALVPLFLFKQRSFKFLWILPALILPSVPFSRELGNFILGGLFFTGSTAHNASIHYLLTQITGSIEVAGLISLLTLMMVIAFVTVKSKDTLKGAFSILAAVVMLSSVVHYWYLSWLLPGLVMFPHISWFLLTVCSGFYFTAWWNFGKSGNWVQSGFFHGLQWIPFYLLWFPPFVRRLRHPKPHSTRKPLESISVVIPSLNERTNLPQCLGSLKNSEFAFNEIVVADGGSIDDSETVVKDHNIIWIQAPKGRGNQISSGISKCTGEVILVLHADSSVRKSTPYEILKSLNLNPTAVGGAVGQRFTNPIHTFRVPIVDAVNDFRAQFIHTNFGDQGQFFIKTILDQAGGFPKIALMEDIELSSRLKKRGDLLFLNASMSCSPRRWENEPFLHRSKEIIVLIAKYKWAKFFGRDNTQKLYKRYYGKSK